MLEIPRRDCGFEESSCGKVTIPQRRAVGGSLIPSHSLLKLVSVNAEGWCKCRSPRFQALSLLNSLLCIRRAGETSAGEHPEAENGKSREPSVSFADATEARRPGTASVASRRPGISEVWFCGRGAGAVCNLLYTPSRLPTAATLSRFEGCTVEIGGERHVCQ